MKRSGQDIIAERRKKREQTAIVDPSESVVKKGNTFAYNRTGSDVIAERRGESPTVSVLRATNADPKQILNDDIRKFFDFYKPSTTEMTEQTKRIIPPEQQTFLKPATGEMKEWKRERDPFDGTDRIALKYKLGQLMDDEGRAWSEVASGADSTKAKAISAELERMLIEYPELQRSLEPQKKNLLTRVGSFLQSGVEGVAEMAPTMIRAQVQGAKVGLPAATGAGVIAGAAGQAGPQIVLPEEVITVPSAMILGYKAGSSAGTAEYMFHVERGQAFKTMINEGVPPEIANKWSFLVGAANAGIELAQLGELADSLKVAGNFGKELASEGMQKYLKKDGVKQIAKYIGGVATETGQEVAQEAISVTGETMGRKEAGQDVKLVTKDNFNRLLETAKDSAKAFMVLQGAGQIGGSAYRAATGQNKKAIQTVVNEVRSNPELLKEQEVVDSIKTLIEEVKATNEVVQAPFLAEAEQKLVEIVKIETDYSARNSSVTKDNDIVESIGGLQENVAKEKNPTEKQAKNETVQKTETPVVETLRFGEVEVIKDNGPTVEVKTQNNTELTLGKVEFENTVAEAEKVEAPVTEMPVQSVEVPDKNVGDNEFDSDSDYDSDYDEDVKDSKASVLKNFPEGKLKKKTLDVPNLKKVEFQGEQYYVVRKIEGKKLTNVELYPVDKINDLHDLVDKKTGMKLQEWTYDSTGKSVGFFTDEKSVDYLEESKTPVEKSTKKQDWEMTKAEYIKNKMTSPEVVRDLVKLQELPDLKKEYLDANTKMWAREHKNLVFNAYSVEGKEISDQVLSDYFELIDRENRKLKSKKDSSLNSNYTELKKSKNEKTGKTIYEFAPVVRLSTDEWKSTLSAVRKLRGNYWKGKFYFITDSLQDAQNKFDSVVNSTELTPKETKITEKVTKTDKKVTETKKNVQKDDRLERKKVADKLRDGADALQKIIDNKMSDRLANTARRANIAASAYAEGEALQRRQSIMRAIADDIEIGAAKRAVSNMSTRADVEMTYKFTQMAVADFVNAELQAKFGKNYSSIDKDKITITNKASDYADMPWASPEQLGYYLRDFKDKPGFKRDVANVLRRHDGRGKGKIYFHMYPEVVELLEKAVKVKDGYLFKDRLADFKRLQRLGVTTKEGLQQLVYDFFPYYQIKGDGIDKIKRQIKLKEQELARMKIEGFFPTPKRIVEQMLELADVQSSDKVLEPSAGAGSIADEIGVGKVDVVEWNSSLNSLLKDKGHNVIGSDVFEVSGEYDKIIMNPPFEKLQDVDHVMQVYNNNLKQGGRIVAIMSESPFFRSDKKAIEFREWLDGVGYSEKLPDGSFKESDRSTGVATRIVVIDKSQIENQVESKKESKAKGKRKLVNEYKVWTTENGINEFKTESTGSKLKPVHEIMKDIQKQFKVGVTSSRFRNRKAYAHYKVFPQVIESKIANTIEPLMHELGHHLGYKYNFNDNPLVSNMITKMPSEFTTVYRKDELRFEAVAEFLRLYMTSPADAKEYGGDFYKEFEETLKQKGDLEKVQDVRNDVLTWLNGSIQEQVKSTIINRVDHSTIKEVKSDFKSSLQMLGKKAYMYLFDELLPLQEFVKYIEKSTGKKLDGKSNAYLLAMQSLKAPTIAKQITTDALLNREGDVIGPSFKYIFKDIDEKSYDDFNAYLIAKRALDYWERGKRAFSDDIPISYVEALVAVYESERPEFVETAENLYNWWTTFTEEWIVGSGLMEKSIYEHMKELEPHYVPFFRLRNENVIIGGAIRSLAKKGYVDLRNPLKRSSAKGSADPIFNPVESMIMEIERYVTTVKRRDVMLSIHDVYSKLEQSAALSEQNLLEDGLGHIINKVNPRMAPDKVNMIDKKIRLALDLYDEYSKTLSAKDKVKYQELKKQTENGEISFEGLLDFFHKRGFNAFEVVDKLIDDVEMEFKPMEFDREKNIISVKDQNGNTVHYEVYDKFLLEALLNTDNSSIDKLTRTVAGIRRVVQALITTFDPVFIIRNLMRDTQQGFAASDISMHKYHKALIGAIYDEIKGGEWSTKYKQTGGGFASPVGASRNALKESISEIVPGWKKKHRLETTLQHIEKFSDAIEQAPRIAEFKDYVEKHGDTFENRLEALFKAQDVTVNFNRKGQIMRRWYGNFIPFLNPALQGLDKTFRMNTRDFKKTFPRALVGVTLTSLLVYALNYDDEEYKKANKYIKDSYYLIPTGIPGKWIRIPKPREIGMLYGSTFERALDMAVKKDPDAWNGFLSNLLQTFTPPMEIITKGLSDAKNNKTWYGGEIVPMQYQLLEKDQQFNDRTSWFSKQLAKIIPDSSNLSSPMVLDYLIQQYTGVIGKYAVPATDSIKGNALEHVMKSFTTDVAYSNNVVPKFYDRKREMESAIATAKAGKPVKGYKGLNAKPVFDKASEIMSELRTLHDSIDKMPQNQFNEIKESASKQLDTDLKSLTRKEFKRALKIQMVRIAEYANYIYDTESNKW